MSSPYLLEEVEILRITVAHLQAQNAQLQAQSLLEARDRLIRETLLSYVPAAELAQYVIDLERGRIRLRDPHPATEEPQNAWEPIPSSSTNSKTSPSSTP